MPEQFDIDYDVTENNEENIDDDDYGSDDY